jgi:hypothetical protein
MFPFVRRLALLLAFVALTFAAPADAVLLGVRGDKARFENQTGQQSQINLRFIPWGLGLRYAEQLDNAFARSGPIPMIAFGTTAHEGVEQIKPRGIARGEGDKFLLLLGRRISRYGTDIYVRPLAEMNGHWNRYCAFNANGTRRGEAYSVRNFKRAFRRIYLIVHGGSRAEINSRLDAIGLPHLRTDRDLPVNANVRVVWNPQGYGSPDIPQNSANSYYPGNRYVDVVANDLYDINYNAEWEANTRLLKSHPDKPYGIGEWGLWGIDDPAFVRHMANFIERHNRVEFANYYESVRGSIFDLADKPNSRRAYRRNITPLG